jgi:hypothetical protein
MSDAKSTNSSQERPIPEGGILAALPRARPQRASPRRAAARTAASQAATRKEPAKPKKPARSRPTASKKQAAAKTRTANAAVKPAEPPAPKQGYEPEDEVELGATVNPPSGIELVESLVDVVGELANSGLNAGGRLFKDAFSLLRRP